MGSGAGRHSHESWKGSLELFQASGRFEDHHRAEAVTEEGVVDGLLVNDGDCNGFAHLSDVVHARLVEPILSSWQLDHP